MPYQVVHPGDEHPDHYNWIGIISSDGCPEGHSGILREVFQRETNEVFQVSQLYYRHSLGWKYADGFVIRSLPHDVEKLNWIKNQIQLHKYAGIDFRRTNAIQP